MRTIPVRRHASMTFAFDRIIRGWYGDFDIAEPAPNDYGTVK